MAVLDSLALRPLERVHDRYVFRRRCRVLADVVAPLLSPNAEAFDVGCGDGTVAAAIASRRPDVSIRGFEVAVRPTCAIPAEQFDGRTLPAGDGSADSALLIDVLHHATNPAELMAEAKRVARKEVVIKDHLLEGLGAHRTLVFLDRVGNARYGVDLPYRYFQRSEWHRLFADTGLRIAAWQEQLGLYPLPLRPFFERSLHFVARLVPAS